LKFTRFSILLIGLFGGSLPALGQSISADTCTKTGSSGISVLAGKTPAQVDNVYQYQSNKPVTPEMKTNFQALLGNPNSVPEPSSCFIWTLAALAGAFDAGERKPSPVE
jgi:hypothetical protein